MIKRFWCKLWGHIISSAELYELNEPTYMEHTRKFKRIYYDTCPRCGEELGKAPK